ncbi:phage tail-collar fiber domain-containing protein [Acinetobacter calcoaceticus]
MSEETVQVIFKVTAAGRLAALSEDNNGLNLSLNKIGFGNGHYESIDDDQRTELQNKVVEAALSAGGIEATVNTLILSVNFVPTKAVQVSEIGVYAEDGTLFAVASLPEGMYFTLDKGISFVGSFGLALGTTSNITVIVQVDVPIMQQLMVMHETAADPHPQYAKKVDVDDKDQHLQDQIDDVVQEIADLYPRVIASGVSNGNATIDLGNIVSDMRDTKYVISITPEGGHEGWTIARGSKNFAYNVFNRSGTSRVGYGGFVNWNVVQTSPDSAILGDGEYTVPGDYMIGIPAQSTKDIIIVGAGGGGGSFRWSTQGGNGDGADGTNTSLSLEGTIFAIASAGFGGKEGVWGNGSSYENGVGGDGGQPLTVNNPNVEFLETIAGLKGHAESQSSHGGGASVSPMSIYGAGGDGGDGHGDDNWSFGGGGGSGAYIKVRVSNTTTSTMFLALTIGAGGLVPTGFNGEFGVNGFAKVMSV